MLRDLYIYFARPETLTLQFPAWVLYNRFRTTRKIFSAAVRRTIFTYLVSTLESSSPSLRTRVNAHLCSMSIRANDVLDTYFLVEPLCSATTNVFSLALRLRGLRGRDLTGTFSILIRIGKAPKVGHTLLYCLQSAAVTTFTHRAVKTFVKAHVRLTYNWSSSADTEKDGRGLETTLTFFCACDN